PVRQVTLLDPGHLPDPGHRRLQRRQRLPQPTRQHRPRHRLDVGGGVRGRGPGDRTRPGGGSWEARAGRHLSGRDRAAPRLAPTPPFEHASTLAAGTDTETPDQSVCGQSPVPVIPVDRRPPAGSLCLAGAGRMRLRLRPGESWHAADVTPPRSGPAPDFDHFLLTRFSAVLTPGAPPAGADWLRYRLGFFYDATLPSVVSQTGALSEW